MYDLNSIIRSLKPGQTFSIYVSRARPRILFTMLDDSKDPPVACEYFASTIGCGDDVLRNCERAVAMNFKRINGPVKGDGNGD